MSLTTEIRIGATIITEKKPRVFHLEVDGNYKDSISIDDANAICEKLVELGNGMPIVKIATEQQGPPIDIEKGVIDVFLKHSELSKILVAEAMVIESLATRILMGTYMRIKSRNRVFKTFRSETAALEWVNKFIDS